MSLFTPEQKKRWRNVALVRERDDRSTRSYWVLLLGIVVALSPLAIYLIEQMQYVRVQYQIEEVRKDYDRFLEAEQRFRAQRATMECLPTIEKRAAALGLVHPSADQVVIVRVESAALNNLLARAPDDSAPGR
jgi:hypothetical protein